jgi:benzoate-CoA ligase
MVQPSRVNRSTVPPSVVIARDYNAAHDLIERNLAAGRRDKVAYIDDGGRTTYGELATRVNRFANVLGALDLRREERVLLCLLDTIDFPTAFLGSIKAGVIPIAANTLLNADDYRYMLSDSRARALVVSKALWPNFKDVVAGIPSLRHIIVAGGEIDGIKSLSDLMAGASDEFRTADTTCDDPCFWLYSSGSTGRPKGTVHVHSSLIQTAELYAIPVLGIREDDVVFSAAKLFFAYGLGNGLSFPMSVGATTVLMAERPTPDAVFKRLREHQPTIFYGVPTLFAAILAHADCPGRGELRLRSCTSAGEALPEQIGQRWLQRFGVDILDGIGSTEMLHIFLSNRPGEVRYGTTGKPVPGYELRIVAEDGAPVGTGEVGELQVRGPSAALMYWNNLEKTRATFQGGWTRSGDKYSQDADGYFVYAGRSDDMLKVSGIYVSPIEVESALVTHDAVLEAAVVGREDDQRLVKPIAYVVLKPGRQPTPDLSEELKQHVKTRLAPYKYPRWIEFVPDLPKTATGKIQRFKLRSLQR